MNLREKYQRTKQTLIPSIIVFVIYGGLLLIEGLFLEGGDLYVSLVTLYAGIVCIGACLLFCLVLPLVKKEAVIVCTLSQLTFLGVGTYLRELEFYFFFLIMLFCVISVTKSFKAMLWFFGITLFINSLAFAFLFSRIEWLNSYRFFMQFSIAIFGAVFMLIQAYHINNKENRSDRALASFSSLLQSTPNFMIITDENSRVRYISEPMVKFADLKSAELAVGKPLLDLFPDRKLKKMFASILRAENNNETVVSIDIDDETRHFKVIADKLSGDAEGLFIDISDITVMVNLQKNTEKAWKAAEEANIAKTRFLEYNSKLATATNLATTYMLHSDINTFNSNLHKAFDLIGKTISVERVYIWNNHVEDGVLCCTQLYEWSEGAEPQQGNELTVSVPYEALPYWGKMLSSNNCINSFVRNLPEGEREHLEEQDILSILAMPIFIDEKFWGFIGFDDCKSERVFLEEEETLLRSCGLLFAHAYHRNEMLKEIANIEERVQLMFDSTPLAVTLWNRQLQIVDCNKNTIETFGYDSKQDFIEGFMTKMPEFQPNGDPTVETIAKEIGKTFDEGYNHIEYTHLTKSGEPLPLDVTLVRIKLRADHAVVIYARDLREHKKMLEEMRRIEIVEQANKAKSQFLATMSHEIRTPMNAILGITQMELQDPNLPAKNASALDKIYNSGSTLLGIINDILDMSKIESGKLELNPIEYDVPSLIHDATQLNVVRIGSKNIQFFIEADKNLPSRLIGDELRIKQILNNLLSNAFKYTEVGTVKLKIRGGAEGDGVVKLQFIVEDSGQGLKPEDLKKLFSEEYLRFNLDSNQKTEGTGLGLNITKNLIDLMEGDISAQSEYGKGSIFTVNIVQRLVPNAPPIGIEVSEKLKNFAFTGKKGGQQIIYEIMPYGKVLVVDDVDTNLYVAQGLMSPYELMIDTAISGFKALEILENNHYDIVFMDHMMPLMDGIETTKKLRENGYKGTIIALTANAIVGNAEMFKQNGFDDFLSKPIDIRQLNAFLNKWVRDKHPEEAIKYRNQQKIDVQNSALKTDNKLLEVFYKDAEKASITLREALENNDLPLFTTTVHAMKSALANIGELDKSTIAAKLEDAGRENDMEYIQTHTSELIQSLEELVEKYAPNDIIDDSNVIEDTVYLKEQLLIIKNACLEYDDKMALSVIEYLKEKPWQNATIKILDEIHDLLYLASDFDEAARMVSEFESILLS